MCEGMLCSVLRLKQEETPDSRVQCEGECQKGEKERMLYLDATDGLLGLHHARRLRRLPFTHQLRGTQVSSSE